MMVYNYELWDENYNYAMQYFEEYWIYFWYAVCNWDRFIVLGKSTNSCWFGF